MTAQTKPGWTAFSYPLELTQQPACANACHLTREGRESRAAHGAKGTQ